MGIFLLGRLEHNGAKAVLKLLSILDSKENLNNFSWEKDVKLTFIGSQRNSKPWCHFRSLLFFYIPTMDIIFVLGRSETQWSQSCFEIAFSFLLISQFIYLCITQFFKQFMLRKFVKSSVYTSKVEFFWVGHKNLIKSPDFLTIVKKRGMISLNSIY